MDVEGLLGNAPPCRADPTGDAPISISIGEDDDDSCKTVSELERALDE